MVSREVFATVPVTVQYSLTPLGQTLAVTVETVRRWAEGHIHEVVRAQEHFDART